MATILSSFQKGDLRRNKDRVVKTTSMVEPHKGIDVDTRCWRKIISEFRDHLAESASRSLGYPVNLNCNHYIALSPLLRFHVNNAGDPFNESNFSLHSKKFEVGVLNWFSKLWGIEKDEYWGYITNGGTEGNLQGLLLGRELLPDGVLYASRESHYSIFKAARMYRMNCEIIHSLIAGEIDCKDLKEKLLLNKDKPAVINLNIGSTFKGAVDNLNLVIETLHQCGFSNDQFYIHCDAALNGLISPLLDQEPSFSFKKPIGSISVSAHKLLGSPMPCGVFMTKKRYIPLLAENIEYIASVDTTISGSRNGLAAVFIWYGLNVKGLVGLKRDIRMCLRNAQYIRDGLWNAGISTMLNENSNIVVFERPLMQDFTDHWQLSYLQNMARIAVMPHVTTKMLDEFLNDFVQKRSIWYGSSNEVQPPCLADDIGNVNCACLIKHNNKRA